METLKFKYNAATTEEVATYKRILDEGIRITKDRDRFALVSFIDGDLVGVNGADGVSVLMRGFKTPEGAEAGRKAYFETLIDQFSSGTEPIGWRDEAPRFRDFEPKKPIPQSKPLSPADQEQWRLESCAIRKRLFESMVVVPDRYRGGFAILDKGKSELTVSGYFRTRKDADDARHNYIDKLVPLENCLSPGEVDWMCGLGPKPEKLSGLVV